MKLFAKKIEDTPGDDNVNSGNKPVDNVDPSVEPWEYPGNAIESHASFSFPTKIGHTLTKVPHQEFDQEPEIEKPTENIFHPVQAINDILASIREQTAKVTLLTEQLQRERVFLDRAVSIGATVGFEVEYADYKYLYMLSSTSITLNSASGGISVVLIANKWTSINLPRGSLLTVSGGSDVSPNVVYVRRCDVPMIDSLTALISGTVPVSGSVGITGTVAVTESGVWTVQPGNTPNTSPWLMSFSNNNVSVPTGAGNTVIKNAPGQLANVVVTTTGTGAGNVVIFDNASTNAGTQLFAFPANATAGTSFFFVGTAKVGITATNVLNGPVFTVYFA